MTKTKRLNQDFLPPAIIWPIGGQSVTISRGELTNGQEAGPQQELLLRLLTWLANTSVLYHCARYCTVVYSGALFGETVRSTAPYCNQARCLVPQGALLHRTVLWRVVRYCFTVLDFTAVRCICLHCTIGCIPGMSFRAGSHAIVKAIRDFLLKTFLSLKCMVKIHMNVGGPYIVKYITF